MVASVPGIIAAAVLVPLFIIVMVLLYFWKQKKDKKRRDKVPKEEVIYLCLIVHDTLVVLQWNCMLVLCVYFKTFVPDFFVFLFFHIGTPERQVCFFFSFT